MRITFYSPLDCPGCGHEFDGAWIPDATTADQTCPACGYVFTVTWKGWDIPRSGSPNARRRRTGGLTHRQRLLNARTLASGGKAASVDPEGVSGLQRLSERFREP